MSIIEEIRQEREDLARVLKKHPGIRRIVEDLYPDSAHFIYELLQNAEDTGASEVNFVLSETGLVFEHNGRPFNKADIEAITDIGDGTKGPDDEKIGRFGIGFKAVFAHTETPRIWSGAFAFEISELVLPAELEADHKRSKITRFEFPFNSPKKLASDTFKEVKDGFDGMSETTLLFLSHIESIHWKVEGRSEVRVLRIAHSENHVEILKEIGSKATENSHFLRFMHPVEELEGQYTAIAFALEVLPAASKSATIKLSAEQFQIAPVSGRVAVFFTAEKETSGLRFHLHAPFVPELSRASIKDTPANAPLFCQLATLTANSLFTIRDLDLLNADFLAVLPNPSDDLPTRYKCIREAIVDAMNAQPLTPTYTKTHTPAKQLLQAKASLKKLLAKDDIEVLVDFEEMPPTWAIGATQRNSNSDRFLSSLAIKEWDIEQFMEVLEKRFSTQGWLDTESSERWLGSKSDEWHQELYVLLYRELEPQYELARLNDLRIVRLSSGEYRVGSECYFPTEDIQEDLILPRVAKGTYTSGNSKIAQDSARKLLEAIGVREVGEFEQVEAILKQRYSKKAEIPDKKKYKNDLIRFISFVGDDSKAAMLFEDYRIFERADGGWARPDQVYLDAPYLKTGLHAYYGLFGDKAARVALAHSYVDLGVSLKSLEHFAQLTGALTRLEVSEVKCRNNPDWDRLRDVPGNRTSPIDSDYLIPKLDLLLRNPTVEISSLIWKTGCHNRCWLRARYRKNKTKGSRSADSQLVHQLRKTCWVPQGGSDFVRPAEASRDLLPEGFPFDPGWQWIKAVRFGEESTRGGEEHLGKRAAAKELGFEDDEALNDVKWFAKLSVADRGRVKSEYEEYEKSRVAELPDQEPGNSERRAARVGEQAADAPKRVTEKRLVSISVDRAAVKKDTDPYLLQQYTNADGVMICQVCKEALPFKLADGRYFFEAVEFLPELMKHHYQNYLVLCPNHAAMYQYANETAELMKDLFLNLSGKKLKVVLAGENATVYFTATHKADLKTIIAVEDADQLET